MFKVLPHRPPGQALEPRHLSHPEHRAGGGGGLAALHQGPQRQKSQGAAQTRGDDLVRRKECHRVKSRTLYHQLYNLAKDLRHVQKV